MKATASSNKKNKAPAALKALRRAAKQIPHRPGLAPALEKSDPSITVTAGDAPGRARCRGVPGKHRGLRRPNAGRRRPGAWWCATGDNAGRRQSP